MAMTAKQLAAMDKWCEKKKAAKMKKPVSEERKQKRREWSAAGRDCNKTVQCIAWVWPVVGDPIQVGPFKSRSVTLRLRFKAVKKLVEENNARPLDICMLEMYESGLLEEDEGT